jgi:hypothetical protein
MTAPEVVPTVEDMSRRHVTAEQLVWRSLAGLLLFVVLWTALATSLIDL